MSANKAVFLDRDGTINADTDYLYRIEDFEYLANAIDGLKLLQEAGYLLIIITNQSGIARGFFNKYDYDVLTAWMLDDLAKKGIRIQKVYMCPHLPNGIIRQYRMNCLCRKPNLGLFLQAVHEFSIDLSQSIAIGDNERDLSICHVSECKGYIIDPQDRKKVLSPNIVKVASLYEAAKVALSYQD